jgi:hypothetical protein
MSDPEATRPTIEELMAGQKHEKRAGEAGQDDNPEAKKGKVGGQQCQQKNLE